MVSTKIIPAEKKHFKDILNLINELAIYEKEPKAVSLTLDELEMYYKEKLWGGIVCELNSNVVGISIWYDRFSTWKGKFLYLEDIYVKDKFRGKGLGKLLFDTTLDYAKNNHYKGLCWQVLEWNKTAIDFYKKYNCNFDNEWINGKILF